MSLTQPFWGKLDDDPPKAAKQGLWTSATHTPLAKCGPVRGALGDDHDGDGDGDELYQLPPTPSSGVPHPASQRPLRHNAPGKTGSSSMQFVAAANARQQNARCLAES